ncbi:MAG: M20 family peptidase [Pseudomonadota bacterium]
MKQSIYGFGFLLLVFLSIILLRTVSYGRAPVETSVITLPAPPAVSADLGAEHLSEAVRFRTITRKAGDPSPENAGPWLAFHVWLGETYPLVHQVMVRETVANYSLLYTWQGSDPSLDPIVFMAHQDVVPVNEGTQHDWTAPPFDGQIIDGYIYGRGTLDDKGSLVALMEAAEALIRSGFQPRRTVHFLFGHDEEVAGTGASTIVDLLHDRGVRAEMVLDEGFFVIEDSPLTGAPFGFIGVAEKGYLNLRLTVSAEGGHSSTPPRNSANVRLARAVLALDENQMKADFSKPPVSDLFRAAADDMGFFGRMAFANLWLFRGMVEAQMQAGGPNAMIRTTTAPTLLEGSVKENVLPQRASAVVNFRVHPNDSIEDVIAHASAVTRHIDGLEIARSKGGIGAPASPVSPSDNTPFAVLSAVASYTGGGSVPVGPALVLGATDARFASKISDNVYRFVPSYMPIADTTGFHGTNERLSVANMGRMAEGYAQIILTMDSLE